MNDIIQIQQLGVAFGSKQVLQDVSTSFPANRFSVLLGANGSGKSTLFRVIAGLHTRYSGKLYIDGKDSSGLRFRDRASLIGFLPQFHQSVFPFSVEEIMLTGRAAFARLAPDKKDRLLLEEILQDLQLLHLRKEPFTQLSGGEQQMVMIGRLLMQSPRIILLDEPTNHLDVYYQHYLMHKLKACTKKHVSVIVIMHNPTLAYQYADEFYFMQNGSVQKSDSFSNPDLERLCSVYKTDFVHVRHNNLKIVLPNYR